jgi:hypothetical protein
MGFYRHKETGKSLIFTILKQVIKVKMGKFVWKIRATSGMGSNDARGFLYPTLKKVSLPAGRQGEIFRVYF